MAAREVLRLTHDHRADPELAHQPAAEPARRERGDHHTVRIVAAAPGIAEGVGLAVDRGVALLDPAVVAPPEQGPVALEEGRADRDAPFVEADPCLGHRHLEELGGLVVGERAVVTWVVSQWVDQVSRRYLRTSRPPVKVGW